jgi:hypothetical protein
LTSRLQADLAWGRAWRHRHARLVSIEGGLLHFQYDGGALMLCADDLRRAMRWCTGSPET